MDASQRKVEVSTHACMPLDPSTARMHTSHTHNNTAMPPCRRLLERHPCCCLSQFATAARPCRLCCSLITFPNSAAAVCVDVSPVFR